MADDMDIVGFPKCADQVHGEMIVDDGRLARNEDVKCQTARR